jgi:hypothetical protein
MNPAFLQILNYALVIIAIIIITNILPFGWEQAWNLTPWVQTDIWSVKLPLTHKRSMAYLSKVIETQAEDSWGEWLFNKSKRIQLFWHPEDKTQFKLSIIPRRNRGGLNFVAMGRLKSYADQTTLIQIRFQVSIPEQIFFYFCLSVGLFSFYMGVSTYSTSTPTFLFLSLLFLFMGGYVLVWGRNQLEQRVQRVILLTDLDQVLMLDEAEQRLYHTFRPLRWLSHHPE